MKASRRWWLEQPDPGVLIWRTPSGRTYLTGPTVYLLQPSWLIDLAPAGWPESR
jgi:hypothetical protein